MLDLVEIGDRLLDAIARHDTGHAIFHGCWDWHSAVHGHWALLRIARVTGETRFAEAIRARMTIERVAAERALLRERPAFELPYGRAWLLRLAIEYAHVLDDDQRLRALADVAAESLIAHYARQRPSPASREYANASWALVQLFAHGRHVRDDLIASTVRGHVDAHFLAPDDVPSFDHDHDQPDFFSPRANWLYLLAHTQRPAAFASALAAAPIHDDDLAPVEPLQPRAHHYGVNWSRAWALHRLALVTDDARFRRAYEAHVAAGTRDHARGRDDYAAYGHWVPQFAVYALTEDVA